MSKLYFRYGAMGSAKSLNLLAVAHNYRQQEKQVVLMKPAVDDRSGTDRIASRAGLHKSADFILRPESLIFCGGECMASAEDPYSFEHISIPENTNCVLVDESQFLSPFVVDQLMNVTIRGRIPVIAYGLKTDFRGQLFAGSKRLLELADSIEEIKTTCFYCDRKATFNQKVVGGVPSVDGPQVEIGADELYRPACKRCYFACQS